MTKTERLVEFVKRMTAAAPVASHVEAMSLLAATLTAVEDEFSGVANDATGPNADQRMFPPLDERYHFAVEGRTDVEGYKHVAHETLFAHNGAILIRSRRTGEILLDKAGADGRKVNP
jgi:hypothetical protein